MQPEVEPLYERIARKAMRYAEMGKRLSRVKVSQYDLDGLLATEFRVGLDVGTGRSVVVYTATGSVPVEPTKRLLPGDPPEWYYESKE